MKRMLRNKKAVSPVVSAVIMMLIVMIGMSALFGFFVNYAADFQLGSGSSVRESMTVEDVNFVPVGRAQIWVYNVGRVDFKISTIYVNDSLFTPILDQVIYNGRVIVTNGSIPLGAHVEISVYNLPGGEGDSYTFKIVTERGTSFEGVYTR